MKMEQAQIQLSLTPTELSALYLMLCSIGGHPATTMRGTAADILVKAEHILREYDNDMYDRIADIEPGNLVERYAQSIHYCHGSNMILEAAVKGPKKEIFVDGHKYVLVK